MKKCKLIKILMAAMYVGKLLWLPNSYSPNSHCQKLHGVIPFQKDIYPSNSSRKLANPLMNASASCGFTLRATSHLSNILMEPNGSILANPQMPAQISQKDRTDWRQDGLWQNSCQCHWRIPPVFLSHSINLISCKESVPASSRDECREGVCSLWIPYIELESVQSLPMLPISSVCYWAAMQWTRVHCRAWSNVVDSTAELGWWNPCYQHQLSFADLLLMHAIRMSQPHPLLQLNFGYGCHQPRNARYSV